MIKKFNCSTALVFSTACMQNIGNWQKSDEVFYVTFKEFISRCFRNHDMYGILLWAWFLPRCKWAVGDFRKASRKNCCPCWKSSTLQLAHPSRGKGNCMTFENLFCMSVPCVLLEPNLSTMNLRDITAN